MTEKNATVTSLKHLLDLRHDHIVGDLRRSNKTKTYEGELPVYRILIARRIIMNNQLGKWYQEKLLKF